MGTTRCTPTEVVTDRAAAYLVVLEELLPAAWHRTDRYANNHIEADHARLNSRLHPMRAFTRDRSDRVVRPGMRWCRTSDAGITSSRSRNR